MKNRIEEILTHYNLSSGQFADDIGVLRSSISHILSERNKPSLDLVQKILAKYRDINTDWLLFGKGTMLKTNQQKSLFSTIIESDDNNLKNDHIEEKKIDPELKEGNIFDLTTNNSSSSKINTDIQNISNVATPTLDKNENGRKKIEKVLIFYEDKTFSIYHPE